MVAADELLGAPALDLPSAHAVDAGHLGATDEILPGYDETSPGFSAKEVPRDATWPGSLEVIVTVTWSGVGSLLVNLPVAARPGGEVDVVQFHSGSEDGDGVGVPPLEVECRLPGGLSPGSGISGSNLTTTLRAIEGP